MFTKEYVREVLEQMCAPYMMVPLSDEYVQKIYDGFVEIRNSEAVEHSYAADGGYCPRCDMNSVYDGCCIECGVPPATANN